MDVVLLTSGGDAAGPGAGSPPSPSPASSPELSSSPSSSSSSSLDVGADERAAEDSGSDGNRRQQPSQQQQHDGNGAPAPMMAPAPVSGAADNHLKPSSSSAAPPSLPSERVTDENLHNELPKPSDPSPHSAAAAAITPSSLTPLHDEGDNDNEDENSDGEDESPATEAGVVPGAGGAALGEAVATTTAAAAAPAANDDDDRSMAPPPATPGNHAFLSRREWEALRKQQQQQQAGGRDNDNNGADGGRGAGAAASGVRNGSSSSSLPSLPKPPPPPPPPPPQHQPVAAVEIIDLLDSDSDSESGGDDREDDGDGTENGTNQLPRKHQVPASSPHDQVGAPHGPLLQPPPGGGVPKRQRVDSQYSHANNPGVPMPYPHPSAAAAAGAFHYPPPHGGAMAAPPPLRLSAAAALPGAMPHQRHADPMAQQPHYPRLHPHPRRPPPPPNGPPEYVPFPPGFRPTWAALMPDQRQQMKAAALPSGAGPPRRRYYRLSLLNVNQFTITGLSPDYNEPPTSIAGLRVPIRQISRDHGRAVFDQEPSAEGDPGNNGNSSSNNSSGPGRWRIPLGAYHAFYAYLVSDPNTRVDGIPPHQLQIASLERARQEKGYPTADAIVERGVPPRLARALAPFQRGGVDFVVEKGGRALIADDMGLGKTIQGIASMAVFRDEWPVLVLCPSSARYHWEAEFLRWLGVEDDAADDSTEANDGTEANGTNDSQGSALSSWQINVLTNSKSDVFPYPDTRVVVCTYGLALALVQSGKIQPGMFGCAIVDESHMLKNKSSKRSKALVPLLRSTPRCVLLSGTPALARPAELWPQLDVLGVAGRNGFWDDESDFMNKYVKRGGMTEKAELHTMLTGTIMIRRLKHDILKDLPRKVRSQALLHILTADQCSEFKGLLAKLRKSKGTLGEFARSHHAALGENSEEPASEPKSHARVDAEAALRADLTRRLHDGRQRIQSSIENVDLSPEARNSLLHRLDGELRHDLDKMYMERSASLDAQLGKLPGSQQEQGGDDTNRTTLLSHMYGLTGDCKIPLIVDMLQRWLADPTKGKLCIFAHHLSVLNAIRDKAGLSNERHSRRKFIRIDGATMPKQRQELIKKFQSDPSVRIALLGITAAGVAVTLTASSTVWFAELFWTPALMIQAEDRCHRIGQQARVNCLYFVARGTLDEILWKLIEKKFQDLGEFVEGKEKLKLVVENVYESEKELHGMFATADDAEEDDADFGLDETGIGNELSFDDFADDIALLGQEECAMLQIDSDDDDEGESAVPKADRKVPAVEARASCGQSENDAIVLIDDDDEEEQEEKPGNESASTGQAAEGGSAPSASTQDRVNNTIPDCRLYKLRVESPSLGVELALYHGRPVVVRITGPRLEREVSGGSSGKPALGDILVGVNGWPLPLVGRIEDIVKCVRSALARVPMELTCAECPSLRDRMLAARQAALLEEERLRRAAPQAGADGVIEIDDDDDDE